MSQGMRGGSDPVVDAEWLALSDALVRGVGHAMNNRIAALSAVVQVLTTSGQGGPLVDALAVEAQRLLRTADLMRLLPRRWDAEAEPVLLPEVIRSAMELLPLHADLPDLTYVWQSDAELPPVLSEPSLLAHTACMMMACAAEEAARSGATRILIRGTSGPETVSLSVGPESGWAEYPPAVSDGESGEWALERLARRAGGELRVEKEGLVLEMPTLSEARRRQREREDEISPLA
jgi:hypothetical protein